MSGTRGSRNPAQVVVGLAILAVAVLFLLDNMGIADAWDYIDYWPVVIIALSAARIIQAQDWSRFSGAMAWMLIGVWLLGRNLHIIRISVFHFWPVILAGVGALLVFRGWRGYDAQTRWRRERDEGPSPGPPDDGWVTQTATRGSSGGFSDSPSTPGATPEAPSSSGAAFSGAACSRSRCDNTANMFVIMGGVTRRMSTQEFTGGTVVAVMGGATLDLRGASITQDRAVIDVVAFWGGVEILVPNDWTVDPEVFPLMGGYEDRTGPRAPGLRKRLVIRGVALMGGVEVKS
jgi:hypothetical protein